MQTLNFIISQNPQVETSLLNYKSDCPHRYKIAVIKNRIYQAKNFFSGTFYKELGNRKETLINNNFPKTP